MKASPSAELASFAATLRYEDIPTEVAARAIDLFVDWVGSALAGKGTRPIETIAAFA
ncbi:MmgE/PrpD family protein, partial [Rhizobiaceae sp. 2RAB30]